MASLTFLILFKFFNLNFKFLAQEDRAAPKKDFPNEPLNSYSHRPDAAEA